MPNLQSMAGVAGATTKESIMRAKRIGTMVLVSMAMFCGQALAEAGKFGVQAAAIKVAAWDRVGDLGAVRGSGQEPSAAQARIQAPGEDGLQARKAEMVRRMFWIMLAHH